MQNKKTTSYSNFIRHNRVSSGSFDNDDPRLHRRWVNVFVGQNELFKEQGLADE